jgi:hypothetical protein
LLGFSAGGRWIAVCIATEKAAGAKQIAPIKSRSQIICYTLDSNGEWKLNIVSPEF